MKKFEHETIIITKNAWKFMRNFERELHGFNPISNEQLDKIWGKITLRNGGANPKDFPIAENEIRVDKDTFNCKWENVKVTLSESGFDYRKDGFTETGTYL